MYNSAQYLEHTISHAIIKDETMDRINNSHLLNDKEHTVSPAIVKDKTMEWINNSQLLTDNHRNDHTMFLEQVFAEADLKSIPEIHSRNITNIMEEHNYNLPMEVSSPNANDIDVKYNIVDNDITNTMSGNATEGINIQHESIHEHGKTSQVKDPQQLKMNSSRRTLSPQVVLVDLKHSHPHVMDDVTSFGFSTNYAMQVCDNERTVDTSEDDCMEDMTPHLPVYNLESALAMTRNGTNDDRYHSRQSVHYMCTVCEFSTELHTDYVKVPETNKLQAIWICDYSSTVFADYVQHRQTHEVIDIQLTQMTEYVCGVCHYSTVRKNRFIRHIRNEKTVVEYECKIPIYTRSRKCNYQKHQNYGTVCNVCELISKRKSHHTIKCKKTVSMYRCKQCKYTTKVKSNLKKHKVTHEYKTSTSIWLIPKGRVVHHGNDTYKCDQCEYRTKYTTCFMKHMKNHTSQQCQPIDTVHLQLENQGENCIKTQKSPVPPCQKTDKSPVAPCQKNEKSLVLPSQKTEKSLALPCQVEKSLEKCGFTELQTHKHVDNQLRTHTKVDNQKEETDLMTYKNSQVDCQIEESIVTDDLHLNNQVDNVTEESDFMKRKNTEVPLDAIEESIVTEVDNQKKESDFMKRKKTEVPSDDIEESIVTDDLHLHNQVADQNHQVGEFFRSHLSDKIHARPIYTPTHKTGKFSTKANASKARGGSLTSKKLTELSGEQLDAWVNKQMQMGIWPKWSKRRKKCEPEVKIIRPVGRPRTAAYWNEDGTRKMRKVRSKNRKLLHEMSKNVAIENGSHFDENPSTKKIARKRKCKSKAVQDNVASPPNVITNSAVSESDYHDKTHSPIQHDMKNETHKEVDNQKEETDLMTYKSTQVDCQIEESIVTDDLHLNNQVDNVKEESDFMKRKNTELPLDDIEESIVTEVDNQKKESDFMKRKKTEVKSDDIEESIVTDDLHLYDQVANQNQQVGEFFRSHLSDKIHARPIYTPTHKSGKFSTKANASKARGGSLTSTKLTELSGEQLDAWVNKQMQRGIWPKRPKKCEPEVKIIRPVGRPRTAAYWNDDGTRKATYKEGRRKPAKLKTDKPRTAAYWNEDGSRKMRKRRSKNRKLLHETGKNVAIGIGSDFDENPSTKKRARKRKSKAVQHNVASPPNAITNSPVSESDYPDKTHSHVQHDMKNENAITDILKCNNTLENEVGKSDQCMSRDCEDPQKPNLKGAQSDIASLVLKNKLVRKNKPASVSTIRNKKFILVSESVKSVTKGLSKKPGNKVYIVKGAFEKKNTDKSNIHKMSTKSPDISQNVTSHHTQCESIDTKCKIRSAKVKLPVSVTDKPIVVTISPTPPAACQVYTVNTSEARLVISQLNDKSKSVNENIVIDMIGKDRTDKVTPHTCTVSLLTKALRSSSESLVKTKDVASHISND